MAGATDDVRVDVVGASDWSDVATLFDGRGTVRWCWCMGRRVANGREWRESEARTNRERLRRGVRGGTVNAVLARAGDEPIGWCSFGPRGSFARIRSMRSLPKDAPSGTWTIVCFFVVPEWRRRGVSRRLVQAATTEAFERGAERVEAFPVDPERASSAQAGDAWTGFVSLFEGLGFERTAEAGNTRTIVAVERSRWRDATASR